MNLNKVLHVAATVFTGCLIIFSSTAYGQATRTIEHIKPGPRLSGAVVHNGIVYVSGQVAETPNADVPTQTREVLAKIDKILAEAGSDKRHLLNASIWLSDIITFSQMNESWDAWIAPGPAPARATVEARIANAQWRVEIAVIAAVKSKQ